MNNSGSTNSSTVSWVKSPEGRGTLDLVVSCIVTFTLCVWSALHLNVPPIKSTPLQLAIEKTIWVLYGIFAPELVVATAASQYIVALWLKREIEKDALHRTTQTWDNANKTSRTWSVTQCYYATMGGFVANVPCIGDDEEEEMRRVTLTPAGIRLLSFAGRLPNIDEAHIRDKSKADWMAKGIVCIQATWMVAQVVGRLIKNLPVSLLEINTCGHVLCAFALYLLWWSKPLDIQDPSILGPGDENVLVLMLLSSKLGAVNDGVPDTRCFYYNFSRTLRSQSEYAEDWNRKVRGNSIVQSDDQAYPMHHFTTEVSRGSSGIHNLSEFHGFGGTAGRLPDENNGFYYLYSITPKVADECRAYLMPPYDNITIRHGDVYCRRARLACRDLRRYRRLHVETLQRASQAADMIWAQKCRRPQTEYQRLYFTIVPQLGETGYYLAETEYLVDHMPNLPSLTNLSLGQVDCHQNVLPAIFAFTALAYGGLHLSAWNDFYPSQAERYIWIAAALWIACSGGLVWSSCSLGLLTKKLGSVRVLQKQRDLDVSPWRRWFSKTGRWSIYVVGVTFAITRIFLVTEAFVSLRKAVPQMYITSELSDFLPHL